MPIAGGEQRAGDPEPGQGHGAQPSHDRRVGEQEQRLGDQRSEGGHRQPEDLAVGRPPRIPGRMHCLSLLHPAR
jgi:hypothetical protein